MELHELKRGDRFRINFPDSDPAPEVYIFDHVDGMYSFNRRESDGAIVHLKQWTPVIKVSQK